MCLHLSLILEESLDKKESTESVAAEPEKTKSLAPIPEVQDVASL